MSVEEIIDKIMKNEELWGQIRIKIINNGHSITKENISKIKNSIGGFNRSLDIGEHKINKLKTNKKY